MSSNRPAEGQSAHVTVRLPASIVERIRSRSPSRNLSDGMRRVAGAGLRHTRAAAREVKAAKDAATPANLDAALAFVDLLAERAGVSREEALALLDERRDALVAMLAPKPESGPSGGDPLSASHRLSALTHVFRDSLRGAGMRGPELETKAREAALRHMERTNRKAGAK